MTASQIALVAGDGGVRTDQLSADGDGFEVGGLGLVPLADFVVQEAQVVVATRQSHSIRGDSGVFSDQLLLDGNGLVAGDVHPGPLANVAVQTPQVIVANRQVV